MMDENFYREQILDHYKSPRNRGELDPHDATAEGQNPLCGDEITVDLRLTGDQRIEAVRFRGQGCAISQAAAQRPPDLETWFQLGRALTPVSRGAALISWSGSMFEYLMPALVMRSPAHSLLD